MRCHYLVSPCRLNHHNVNLGRFGKLGQEGLKTCPETCASSLGIGVQEEGMGSRGLSLEASQRSMRFHSCCWSPRSGAWMNEGRFCLDLFAFPWTVRNGQDPDGHQSSFSLNLSTCGLAFAVLPSVDPLPQTCLTPLSQSYQPKRNLKEVARVF